ncbi:sulfurtransferase [Pseudonocardia sp. KRD291]|uniref:sulfurtransferase n=1 Tax=Pseudonocardia sp. KRD291 TaxID=2792007 RepID=UPI001C4A4FED|nr:sulfurtransferase [Pseudonocardia sp. KRD291]MBW0106942.1 sulfurtransferase [Pseudonocardia sp. KRD291]
MGPVSDLITPAALARDLEILAGPGGTGASGVSRPVVLDVRWRLTGPPGRPDHAARRIPGAVFVDLGTELAAAVASGGGPGGRHPLPDPASLQEVLRRAGVREDSTVVAYDDADGSVAARAWWLLRWSGHPAGRVKVLDGGFAAWTAEGRPLAGDDVPDADRAPEPVPDPGDVVVRPGAMPVLDADGAAALARRGALLDARAGARYRGETEPVDPRAGHVPGALSVPFAGNTGPDGRWLPADELAARFRAAGVTDPTAVGAYCGSGVTASSLVLALEHAGVTSPESPAALYPGSWSEWSADPARPAATGPEPEGAAS